MDTKKAPVPGNKTSKGGDREAVILCALLYPAFALLYFWGTEALKNFSFFGEDGYLFLRHRAEMTCDPKKIIAVKYAGDILKLFFALVLLVLFLSGCFAALLLDRGDREGWTGLLEMPEELFQWKGVQELFIQNVWAYKWILGLQEDGTVLAQEVHDTW